MCKFLPKNTVKANGLVLNILVGIIVISPIFFAGFDYKFVNINWSHKGKWRHLAKLQVSSVCGTFFSFILGILFFAIIPDSKGIGALFSFFEFITGVFSMFVSIFVLVGAYARTNDLTEKCIIPNKNFFEQFFYLDEYFFEESDKLLCSGECNCSLTDNTIDEFFFKYDEEDSNELKDAFADIIGYNNDEEKKIKTQDCHIETIVSNLGNTMYRSKFGEGIEKELKKLMNFWGKIEKKFHCTGWCKKSYKGDDGKTKYFLKYLFSDVNNGLVENIGCMKPYRNWVQKMLRAFGGMMLIDSFLQLICLIFGVSLFLGFYSENSSNERPIEHEEYGATQKFNENEEHNKSN